MIARALEVNNIATALTSWNAGLARIISPPRYTITQLLRGSTLGRPNDKEQQRRVLTATLKLLEEQAPIPPLKLKENQD